MFIDENLDSEREEVVGQLLHNAMGRAALSLEKVVESAVTVDKPQTHWVNQNNLHATLAGLNLPTQSIVIRQSFRGHLRGEIIILLEHGAKHYRLGPVMGYDTKMTPLDAQELTLELANILSGACISGLSDQLDIKLNFGAPSVISQRASVDQILAGKNSRWTDALFMDVGYTVASIAMKTNLILCMVEEDSHQLYGFIDRQLNQ